MIDRKDAHQIEVNTVGSDTQLSYDNMALCGIREMDCQSEDVRVKEFSFEGTEDECCVYRARIGKEGSKEMLDKLYWVDADGDIEKSMSRQSYIDKCKKERESKSRSETTLSEFGEISDGKTETLFEVGTSV